MDKKALIKTVSELEGLNPAVVKRILDTTLEAIECSLAHGDSVIIRGFGQWTVREQPAGKRRNPRDGSFIEVPARNSMRFRAAAGLRDRIKGKN